MSLRARWKLERKNQVPDLVAGAIFAIVNVQQGMANAVLATVNPVSGLYAWIIRHRPVIAGAPGFCDRGRANHARAVLGS